MEPRPGLGELGDNFLQRQVKDFAKMNELARTEAVDVDLREFAFDVRQQIQIPLQRKFGVMAALHQNLRSAQGERLLDLAVHFVEGDDIGVCVLFRAIKGAEFAIDIADIGIIDIAINNVGDDLVAAAVVGVGAGQLAAAVGQRAQFLEGQADKGATPRPGRCAGRPRLFPAKSPMMRRQSCHYRV